MLSLDNQSCRNFDKDHAVHSRFRLDGYFCDHAVLQRDQVIPVCGYAEPDTVVELTFYGITVRSVAAADGRFTINIPPMSATQGQCLRVFNAGHEICCEDISVGEVYLIAGQSNMEFPLSDSVPGPEEVRDEDFESLRYFKIPPRSYYGRQSALQGCWQKISRNDADRISGCGFFFGRFISQKAGIPVGLVDASLGGINLESWVSRETLLAHPAYRQELLNYERSVSLRDPDQNGRLPDANEKIVNGLKKMFPVAPDDGKAEEGWADANFCDQDWESMFLPDSWTEAGHNHAGIFWFRRTIELPEKWIGHALELHLGAIDKSDKVYFDGTLIGETGDPCVWDFWTVPRRYPIPAGLVGQGRHTIAIQVGSMVSICMDGGILGPASEMYIGCPEQPGADRIGLAGLWRYHESYDAGTVGMTFMRSLGAGAPGSFHMLYDNMILPLTGIPMRGVLWYQGEANAICMAKEYETLLRGMLEDWRRTLGNRELEFYLVQLPEYHNPHYFAPFNQWALIREAQNNAALRDPYADCIVTLGWGDVTELHPRNKKAVGEAAGRFALARLNGQARRPPQLQSLMRRARTLELTFTGSALSPVGTVIHGFTVSGDDGNAFKGHAEVMSSSVVKVFSPEVPAPTRVWYAWAGNPVECDFRSADDIMVSPFRAALNGPSETATAKNLIP